MERKETKGRRTQLPGKRSQQVEKKEKEDIKLATTETKQIEATQALMPTEEKVLSAKDLAKMAKVKPTHLRRCLRQHFSGRISTTKGDNGLKTYQIKADDPIVQEILAKLKGNGGKATTPVKAEAPKAKAPKAQSPKPIRKTLAEIQAGKPTPEVVFQSTAGEPSPESLDHIEAFDTIYGGQDSRAKMEKLVANAEETK